MSGAYVAKPAATIEDERPPGWDINWPWPGPFPPGFDWRDYEWPGLPGGGKPSDDDDPDSAPRIVVYPVSGLTTRESDDGTADKGRGGNFFYVVLTSPPTHASIFVPVTSRDDSEGNTESVAREYVTFEEHPHFGNEFQRWDNPRRIWLEGESDDIEDGDVGYTIKVGPSESSYFGGVGPGQVPYPGYNEIRGSDVSVTNIETIWQLRVTVQLNTSTSIGVPLVWPPGYSSAVGWYRVAGPGGGPGGGNWAKSETTDYNYYHPDDAYHTVTEVISSSPESFDVFTKTYTLSHTGVESRYWRITFGVTAAGYNGQWPFGGNWYNIAKSTMTIYAELLRDGVVQSTDTETISASITMPENGGSDSTFDIDSGSMNFLTAEL